MSDFKIVQLLNPIQVNTNIHPTGVYNAATTYGVGDSVSYGSSSYICIAATTGNDPTNTTYWQLLATASTNKLTTTARNVTGATIPKGSVVYFNGSSGNLPTIVLAQANTEASSNRTVGLTSVAIPNNSNGEIVVIGLIESLDTSAFTVGIPLWLSSTVAGGMTNTEPVAPDQSVFIGVCTRSNPTQGTIEINIQNGQKLDELHNVAITSVADNQVLKYDAPNSLWKNETLNSGDVGLGSVDNTSDASKPISTATQTALNTKRDITSIVPIVYGGTGASTEPVARANLGVSMTSLYSGGVVSGLGTATFSVTAGLGYIVSQSLVQLEPTSVAVSFSAVTAVTPLYTRGAIYVNSAGAILQVDVSGTPITQLFKKQNIILASYAIAGGVIISLPPLGSTPILTPNKLEDLMEALGPLNLSGNIYWANGANLLLNKSAGETFQLKSNISNSLEVRDITTDVAASPISNGATAYGYRNGTGGFTLVPYTGVTPNLWDNGSGTPVAVTNAYFTIQRIYYFNRSNTTIIYLGQTEYSTFNAADAAVGTEVRVIDTATLISTLRSSLVVKHNTTDLTDSTKAVFFEASKFGASGAGSSSGTTTLQGAYNNSVTPEIITNATLGAVTVQRGSASDTDNLLEGKNGAGTNTFTVDGNGKTTTDSLVIGSLSGLLKSAAGTVSAATAGTDYENPLTFSAPLSRLVNAVSIPDATTSITGALTSTDWTTFNNKIGNTFESVSKNLRQYDYALNYSSGVLTTIVYTIPSVGTIIKTLNYTSGALTSVVLSGSTPASIQLTKTLTYSSGVLTSIAYT